MALPLEPPLICIIISISVDIPLEIPDPASISS